MVHNVPSSPDLESLMSMEDGSADALQLLREVLKEIQAEEPPSAPDQQEMYFQEHVGQGEQLAAMGE